jgi:PKD repeat protein
VFYYVSSGGEYVQIGSKKATVKPGASKDLEVQWTVPSDVSSNQVIVVKANPSSSVAESDYSNNQGTYTGTARMADLVVSLTAYNATLSSSPAQSAWMRMDATVRNAGTDAANSIVAKIIYDGQVEKQETIPKLLSGESYQFTSAHRLQYGSQQGQYSFTLEADPDNTVNEADESNNEAAATATATPNRPPVPKITISNTNPAKREWVDFSCAGSTDPDTPWGSPACVWDFGDGSEEVHDQVTFHYFTTSGAHVVRLTAVDSFGLNATVTGTVNVKPNQPPSIAMPSSYSAYKGEESSFSAACHDADGTISSVNWNFGDGSTDTGGCDISHTYSSTGAYAITATAYDESGASAFGSSSVSVVNAPALKTKAFSEVYVAHYSNPQVASSGDGPDAQMFYGLYKVDYEVKYTENDNVIRKVKYSIHSGPGIITAITDNDPEFYFIPLTAASGQGGTAMTVTSVAVQQGSTVLWSVPTYSFLSPAESPLVREFSGLEIPVDWGQHNYFTIQSTIEWPSQMCNWEGYNCQQQTALWAMS